MADYIKCETALQKFIKHFNDQLKDSGSDMRLRDDISLYSLRIAKKKNGHPSYS